ncbi:MAG: DUF11 domain-containing protein [Anaerolineales bacterium]|nr:DUF11 domain-containing protein [Anaerolineales bacterium]
MTTAHRFIHRFVSLRSRCRRLSSVAAMVMALQIVLAQVANAANPPPVQIYYVPAPENQVFAALKGIYPGGAPNLCNSAAPDVASPINTYISVSIIAAGTILYYDQWEDDFEVDLAHPVQPTTQIWGDANQANGYPPGNPADILSPDSVVVLSNSVPVPRNPAQLFFDGGDKVGASRPIAMTRALWSGAYPDAPGTLLSDAVEIYDTGRWGTHYQAPVGATTAANQLFEYTGMAVMARTDGTEIAIDANADGTAELNATLAEGESYLVDGGMLAGATVDASAPVQVTLITGDRCDIYESRWYSLFPADRWSGSYYSPVGTPTGGGGTTLWVFNPESTPISVTWAISTGVQAPFNVPARGNAVVLVPNGSGAHLWTADTTPFQAIAAVGSDSISNTDNSRADWGFTLIPEALLTYQSLVGWGAGRDPTSSVNPQENGNPVWVTPIFGAGESGPAQICIDYDGNNDGPFTDAYGFHYDLLLVINALQSRQVFDPDGDQTGMVLYVCDPPSAQTGAELAATWGQAPGVASAGPPSLDLGTTAPPASTFETGKGAEIIPDGDGDGKADPGDRIVYSVIVRNASRTPLSAVSISDTVPAFTTYVTSTTTVNLGAGPQPVPDRTPGDPFPLDRGGVTLPGMPVLGVYTVTFTVLVNFPLPVELERIQNVATVRVGDDTQFPAVDTPVDLDGAVVIKKATNGFDADTMTGPILDVGAPVIWSYAITNTGTVTLAQVSVTDDRGVTPIRLGGSGNELGLGETWYYTGRCGAGPVYEHRYSHRSGSQQRAGAGCRPKSLLGAGFGDHAREVRDPGRDLSGPAGDLHLRRRQPWQRTTGQCDACRRPVQPRCADQFGPDCAVGSR